MSKGFQNNEFEGASFVNAIMLIVFISLLIFGSTNIPDATEFSAFF